MLGVLDEIFVHVPMIGKELNVRIEIEIVEAGDVARRVDVQGAVSGRALVVVFVTPHAADLCADLEDRYVQAGLRQILRRAQSASAGADDGDAFVLWGLFDARFSYGGCLVHTANM